MPKNTKEVKYRKAATTPLKKFVRLKVYSTLSGKKEAIKPIKSNKINLFVCGPTVYDFSHLGHARTYIFFDSFVKYLRHMGFKVFYLQNITDVDDKIILRAKEKGVLPQDLALAFEKEHLKDMKLLLIDSVDKYARATDHIKEIINQIQRLLEKGYAYKINEGVYFDISKFKGYGKLSSRTILQAEDAVSRIDYSSSKHNRGDFCLWKLRERQEEPSWQSPFGSGRPGWHIEDTAITEKFFGAQYDIHGGSRDIIFPHHEAEIAQMESMSGKDPLAKYWLHTGFLTVDGQKMSKSLNNSVLISSFLERYSVQQLRFWVVKNLWRSPVDYSESAMFEVRSALDKVEEFLRKVSNILKQQEVKDKSKSIKKAISKARKDFYKNLSDDFNTPKAFAAVFNLIKSTNKFLDKNLVNKKDANEIYRLFEEIDKIFGIIDFKKIKHLSIPSEVEKLLDQREELRRNKEWEKADEVRKEIEKYRYTVQDSKNGPILKKI